MSDLFDRIAERLTRRAARTVSRRSFLARFGLVLAGVGAVGALPVLRTRAFARGDADGNPESCDYWRYCAIDGFLCACCGGGYDTCPPGTVPSAITWIGTCRHPEDGRDYIISYNDCCGKSTCGRCACQRNEGDTPIYRPQTANDLNWCSGSPVDVPYHCSLSVVIGIRE